MEKNSVSSSKSKTIRRWARIIHRDLGFLMVGVSLVYAISGILLNHMDGKDPAFRTEEVTLQADKGMDTEALTYWWNDCKDVPPLRKVMPIDSNHYRLMLEGGVGVYNVTNGTLDYEKHNKRQFVYWINKLHYNKVKGWRVMGDFFAASLIFFALSGLVMVKGKNGIKGRGKWYLLLGLAIPIIYIYLS